tara:strand:- start:1233 stop:1811 length:579 start_codon:yes stop_codon:yes gene_type:complete
MSDKELTFEELTGSGSVEEWEEDISDDELSNVSKAAQKVIDIQAEISALEAELKAKKEELRNVAEQQLPELMQGLNLVEFTTASGFKISVENFYNAYISEANREKAHNWLQENGHGGLIKNEISVLFGKGQDEAARSLVESLEQRGVSPNVKQGVHPQTLKAFVKEQLTQGRDIPAEPFGIYVGSRAKIEKR